MTNKNVSTNCSQLDIMSLDDLLHMEEGTDLIDNDKIDIVEISIDLLDNSPLNYFSKISDAKYAELKSSISDIGLLTPIIIRSKGKRYEILAGRNRVDVCRELGFKTVPAIVKEVNDEDAEEIISDTNVVQRDDLQPLELAKAYEIKVRQIGKRQGQKSEDDKPINVLKDVGEYFGTSSASVTNYLRLNKLIPEFKKKLSNRQMGLTVCFDLAVMDETTQRRFFDIINGHKDEEKFLKSKFIKAVKNAFNEKNTLTVKEKMKLKREGKEQEVKSLEVDEISEVLKLKNETKGIKISLSIPDDAPDRLKSFVKEQTNENPEWLLEVLDKMSKGEIEF